MATIYCHFCLKALGTLRQQKNTMDPWQHRGGLASVPLLGEQQVLLPSESSSVHLSVRVGSAELAMGMNAAGLRLL